MKNIADLMKQAGEMQSKMSEMQEMLDNVEVEGVAGAGMVKVTLSGKGQMRGVKIDPDIARDDIEILEDLIIAAHNDAKIKSEAKMQEEMQKLTGGLQLPPGFKMPF
jgi:nucleoid-associated protein EbfC